MWYDPNIRHLLPRAEAEPRVARASRRISLDVRRRLERELR